MIERGLVPEELPPAEDIRKVERRLNTEKGKALKQKKSHRVVSRNALTTR
jgi:DNA-damage-inducible protein D